MLKCFQGLGSLIWTKRFGGGLIGTLLGAAQAIQKAHYGRKLESKQKRGSYEIPTVGIQESNGPSYLSPSRFKPLGFQEKKRSPWCSPTPLEACVQLNQCPSYPSKSQEEGERPELLERKRRRDPRTLTGVTKGAPLHSLSRPLLPLFSAGYPGGR